MQPFLVLRWFVVCTQAATIWLTWPLWQVRISPPLLPLADVYQIDFGHLLLGSLALWPRFIEARFAGLLDLAQQLIAGSGAKTMGG